MWSLGFHTDEETDQDFRPREPLRDEHEHGLKEVIIKDIKNKPFLGTKLFQRSGEFIVMIPIGRAFSSADRHTLCSTLSISEDDWCCQLELMQRVVEHACDEARVELVGKVERKLHPVKQVKMYVFKINYPDRRKKTQ